MYKSVIREGKFIVLLADGAFEFKLMELPTEELADKVAFELQTAWDEGESWGLIKCAMNLIVKVPLKKLVKHLKK